MTYPHLDLLVSTCNQRITSLVNMLLDVQSGVRWIIVHQIFDDIDEAKVASARAQLEVRSDVLLITSHERGLSRSRELALCHAKAELCLICDDDVVFRPEAIDTIRKSFADNPSVAVMTFRIEGMDGQAIKPYKEQEAMVRAIPHAREAGYYWSVEIAFRRQMILAAQIQFETRIGLGTNIPTGEDTLFLIHCWERGLPMAHCKQVILSAPQEHSEQQEGYRDWYARGVVWPRVYGWSVTRQILARRHLKALRSAPFALTTWRSLCGLVHGLLANVLYYGRNL